MTQPHPRAYHWIKTACGRAKYDDLAGRRGLWARIRLAWFVLIAALRDWRLPPRDGSAAADQSDEADSAP